MNKFHLPKALSGGGVRLLVTTVACCASLATSGLTANPNDWSVTYDHTGSEIILHGWQVEGVAGAQTATAIDHNITNSYGVSQLAQHRLGFTGGGQTYKPDFTLVDVPLTTSVDIKLKTRVTVRWIGLGPAPTTVKLEINAIASAMFRLGAGSMAIDSGGTDNGRQTNQGMEPIGGPPPVLMPYGNTTSNTSRHREFPLSNGQVSFQAVGTAQGSGVGQWGAGVSYTIAPTDWSLNITSDRDTTYRRVEVDGVGVPISNIFEDDGVTLRGGDGQRYGDSVVQSRDSLWEPQGYFISKFVGEKVGSWSDMTYLWIFSDYELNELWEIWNLDVAGENAIWAGFTYLNLENPGPWPFEALAVAEDQEHQINDHFTYRMRIHQPREYVRPRAAFGPDYLKRCRFSSSMFFDFPSEQYSPHFLPSPLIENSTQSNIELQYSTSTSVSSTNGWAFEIGGSLGFPVKYANLLFGGVFSRSGSTTVTGSTSSSLQAQIPPGNRLLFWIIPVGVVKREITAFYHTHGYVSDRDHFTISNYSEIVRPQVASIGSLFVEPE